MNTPVPILVTLGIFIVENENPLNVSFAILVQFERSMCPKIGEQPGMVVLSITVIAGSDIVAKLVHPVNASVKIDITLGVDIVVNDLHP